VIVEAYQVDDGAGVLPGRQVQRETVVGEHARVAHDADPRVANSFRRLGQVRVTAHFDVATLRLDLAWV
jgi:hypothetical protein